METMSKCSTENTVFALYDVNGEVDLKTNYETTFIAGTRDLFIRFIADCLHENEEDYEQLVIWKDNLVKAVNIETLEDIEQIIKELPHTIKVDKAKNTMDLDVYMLLTEDNYEILTVRADDKETFKRKVKKHMIEQIMTLITTNDHYSKDDLESYLSQVKELQEGAISFKELKKFAEMYGYKINLMTLKGQLAEGC